MATSFSCVKSACVAIVAEPGIGTNLSRTLSFSKVRRVVYQVEKDALLIFGRSRSAPVSKSLRSPPTRSGKPPKLVTRLYCSS